MLFKEVQYKDVRPVEGYGPGFFRVGGVVLHGPVIVSAAGAASWDGYADGAALLALVPAVDVLFIGGGDGIEPLPPGLRQQLEAGGIGVELMTTPSAARTYNVLLAEGRRIAAAMLPVGGTG